MILADTSVWIDHFRSADKQMIESLHRQEVVIHPFVTAELALGSLRERTRTLSLLDLLPQLPIAQMSEVRQMIETRALYNLGIGLVDAHLLASVFISPGSRLWTRDKTLRKVAAHVGVDAGLS